jgi:transcriptional regulator with XRE-family HTH domain
MEITEVKKISDNIRKFRELRNITREEMADKLGLSLSGYSKIERSEVDLTITRVQKIAEILKIELSKLMNFDATQIFNMSNNTNTFGGNDATINIQSDEYVQKYIKLLEADNLRLKKLVGEL